MHGLFLHLFAYGFVSMSIWGVRKWPKKSEEKQKYKLHKTLNPLGRKAFRGASFSATKHRKERHDESRVFLFVFNPLMWVPVIMTHPGYHVLGQKL